MRNVSVAFRNQLLSIRDFDYTVTISFLNSSEVLTLYNEDLMAQGSEINISPETSSFPLGSAMAKTLVLVLANMDEKFSKYDFYGASIHVVLSYHVYETDTDDKIDLGTYTVLIPETPGSTIEITAVDDMYKADMRFQTTHKDITAGALFDEVCRYCGLVPETTSFRNSDYVIAEVPDNLTCREIIGFIAMIAGGNAEIMPLADTVSTVNRNKVRIITYDFIDPSTILSGNLFNVDNADTVDGGDFSFDTFDVLNGGTFADLSDFHVFTQNKTLSCGTDDIHITGIQTIINDVAYKAGTEGYMLEIKNDLINDNPQGAVDRIYPLLSASEIRSFELDYISYPLADFGDKCIIEDTKGNTYVSVITSINFKLKGATNIKCSAEPPIRNNSIYSENVSRVIQEARKQAAEVLSDYEIEAQRMNSLASMAMGYHQTVEEQPDGSKITYLHDRPSLLNSVIIYKITADGFFISRDGGQTYVNGFDSNGNAVLNILNAIGINCDWIKSGTLTLGGNQNQDGLLEVYSSDIYVNPATVQSYNLVNIPVVQEGMRPTYSITTTGPRVNLGAFSYGKPIPTDIISQFTQFIFSVKVWFDMTRFDNQATKFTFGCRMRVNGVDHLLSGSVKRNCADYSSPATACTFATAPWPISANASGFTDLYIAFYDENEDLLVNQSVNLNYSNVFFSLTNETNVDLNRIPNPIPPSYITDLKGAYDDFYNTRRRLVLRIDADGLTTGDESLGEHITRISKNNVTTEYLNALGIQAGSVDAENITGSVISGKIIRGSNLEIKDSSGALRVYNNSNQETLFIQNGHMKIQSPAPSGSFTAKLPFIEFSDGRLSFGYRHYYNGAIYNVICVNLYCKYYSDSGQGVLQVECTGAGINTEFINGNIKMKKLLLDELYVPNGYGTYRSVKLDSLPAG